MSKTKTAITMAVSREMIEHRIELLTKQRDENAIIHYSYEAVILPALGKEHPEYKKNLMYAETFMPDVELINAQIAGLNKLLEQEGDQIIVDIKQLPKLDK